jgi:hypothetical protein
VTWQLRQHGSTFNVEHLLIGTRLSALGPTGFEEHNVHINPDKTKLSFALQLAGGGVLPATVWRSGASRCAGAAAAGLVAWGSMAGPTLHCLLHRRHCQLDQSAM